MKNVSNMEGPIAGHYGEELKLGKINWYQNIQFPHFTLFHQGLEEVKDFKTDESVTIHKFLMGPPHHDIDISLSRTPGSYNPITVEYPMGEKHKVTISARPSDSSDANEIILKVEREEVM